MYNKKNVFYNLAKNIRKLREKKNLTQLDVCINTNISRTMYQIYEKNPADIKLSTLLKIANYFNVSIQDLLEN